jgi:hypothetical protein
MCAFSMQANGRLSNLEASANEIMPTTRHNIAAIAKQHAQLRTDVHELLDRISSVDTGPVNVAAARAQVELTKLAEQQRHLETNSN